MNALALIWLGLGLLAADQAPGMDVARLREMLQDRQNSRSQSQAALLLVQSTSRHAEEIVRDGLRQTDSPQVFSALASALRLQRDLRFTEELLGALKSGHPTLCQSATETLAELADDGIVLRLQALAEDNKADSTARQLALWTLGQSGHKSAVIVLLDQLSSNEEVYRQAAAEALASLTGQGFGLDLARWREWWDRHKDLSNERWLQERLAYQASRGRRLEGDLERSKGQVVRLHQQLYSRLPVADRLGQVQAVADHEDAAVRLLAIAWSQELLPTADAVGQRVLADLLLLLSRDGAEQVQRSATLALGKLNDVRAYDRLRSLLQKGSASVRAAAARALPHHARDSTAEARIRRRHIVDALQRALEDKALEVVIEAAEGLGGLGEAEAAPVLTLLLRHPSAPVRQAAGQALERIASTQALERITDRKAFENLLEALLEALDDPIVAVRFSLVGAIGHTVGDGTNLNSPQRARLQDRLEAALVRDADPAVRSRAATVLGQCGSSALLPVLWRRVQAAEEGRVQEKAWLALIEILVRLTDLAVVQEWDRVLIDSNEGPRRLQLLGEVYARWQKREETKPLAARLVEPLISIQLEQGRWAAAFPLVRDSLGRPGTDRDTEQRLQWLLTIGQQALKEGNRAEAQRAVQEAQPHLSKHAALATEFDKLAKQARKES